MSGTFYINEHPVTVLFDSGAPHTFISKGCVSRLGLEVESITRPYNIHSPGGRLVTNQLVRQVPLQIQGRIFATQLIVLPSQKMDIILGMNWMGVHGVILDTVFQSVHINSPIHGSMTLYLMSSTRWSIL